MNRLTLLCLCASICLLAVPAARADLTIETKQNGESNYVYLKGHMLTATSAEGRAIFRGDKRLLWAVDEKGKTYSELTEEDAQAMGGKMNEAMAQMQEAMKNMPADQRAMMEKMMAERMPKAKSADRTVKPTGEKKTINGFECAGYTVTLSDGNTTEVWAADPKALKIDPQELGVFKEFADFMKTMVPGMDRLQELVKDYAHPGEKDVPGFPVLTIEKDAGGKELWRSELVKVDTGAVPPQTFEVPKGYAKTEGMGGGPGGKRGMRGK